MGAATLSVSAGVSRRDFRDRSDPNPLRQFSDDHGPQSPSLGGLGSNWQQRSHLAQHHRRDSQTSFVDIQDSPLTGGLTATIMAPAVS